MSAPTPRPGRPMTDAPPRNRSPRAMPLPPVEWAPEVVPPDQRAMTRKPTLRVVLAYANAKTHWRNR